MSSILSPSPVSQQLQSLDIEEKKSSPREGSLNTKTLEHKIDLILESALEMERNQIQVAAIRTEMHKFLVELSHLNNNVAAEDDEKYSGLEALTVTIEQRFLQTHREILSLQETISGLKGEIINSRNVQRGALDETWRVEIDRREQMWQARMIEEREVWNQRILEERKQWQQSLESQNTQLQRTLQEGILQLRQESQRISNANRFMISNSHPSVADTTLLSRSKPIGLETTIVKLHNLSIHDSRDHLPLMTSRPQGVRDTLTPHSVLGSQGPSMERGVSSNVSTTSAGSLVSAKPKPPNIIIKRPVVKI